MADFGIQNAYFEQFDFQLREFLKQQGSTLMYAATPYNVAGATEYIRQQTVGEAFDRPDTGTITEYTDTKSDCRLLQPTEFVCPILIDQFDLVKQGSPNIDRLASSAARSCGKKIDQRVIAGLGGKSYSKANGGYIDLPGAKESGVGNGDAKELCVAKYDKTQTIAWNDCTANCDSNNTIMVKAGLNSSKINKAVMKLKQKFNNAPLVCVADEYSYLTTRCDRVVASTDFNTQPSLATGFMTPYAGVSSFLPCEWVDHGVSAVQANGTGTDNVAGKKVRYAYIYAVDQVVLGWSMPLHMDPPQQNPERYNAIMILYRGACHCVRLFEESVVRIEILDDLTNVTNDSFAM